ncbi:hypothetical protein ID866_3725 [Astraeus odoratus]|nr:hypothetical protein ID866_3725 [Astraeus odoratus]
MERRATAVIDDAGISIKKFVLSPPLPAPRHIDASRTVIYGTVPPLAFFCIKALAPYADQLHVLDSLRVPYKGDVVDILCPSDGAPPDPRIWAAIAQTMHALPERLRDLDLPLSDNYLPLLQQIPSTPHFSLLTNLALPHCKEVSDDTVGELRRLNTLSALDLRGTRVSSYGLTALSRGLSQDDADVHRKTGPWEVPASICVRFAFHKMHSCCSQETPRHAWFPAFA